MIAHLKLNPLEGLVEKLEIGHTYEFQKREDKIKKKNKNIYKKFKKLKKLTNLEKRD